jgi:Uma2 family endonuclease
VIDKGLHQALTEVRPLPITYSVDDLEFMPEDGNRYELIGGKLFVSRAPHIDHQRIISNLMRVFFAYLDKNPIGEIFTTPSVIFGPNDAVLPDLVYATHATIDRNVAGAGQEYEGKFVAAPEMMIAVLSLGKVDIERDRIYKREVYGQFGVKEYWVVDGLFDTVEVYRLDAVGMQLIKRFVVDETIETPLLPDFSLRLTDVFRK